MSALGQKRTFRSAIVMSALPSKADIRYRPRRIAVAIIAAAAVRQLDYGPILHHGTHLDNPVLDNRKNGCRQAKISHTMKINNNLQDQYRCRMILAAAVAVAVGFGQPIKTYAASPWCAVVNLGMGDMHWDCRYSSLEQCRPNVLAGNRGFCNPNPYYVAGSTKYKQSRKRHARAQ